MFFSGVFRVLWFVIAVPWAELLVLVLAFTLSFRQWLAQLAAG